MFLKDFREGLGYSKSQLASALGISTSLYEKIEWGIRAPSRHFLFRFKQTFPTFDMNIFFLERESSKNPHISTEA